MLLQALLVGLWAGIAGIDHFNGLTHLHRPIVTGPVVGLILGDLTTGLMAGATLELVWAGMVPLAGAQPPNVVIGGIVGTAFAILTGQDPQVAVGVAVPFAVAGQAVITLLFTVMSPVMHKMDDMADEANTRGIDRLNYLEPLILFIFFGVVAFLPIYFGAAQAEQFVTWIPEWILDGLSFAGGIMPAVGFAMLMKIMFKWTYAPFFALGFVAVAYLEMPILGVAIVATAFAAYDYFIGSSSKAATETRTNQDLDEEEDYSDGI
ncbi:PTS sugar transporter subunit IIC [Tetragenococcus halophilus]|uniref:PTS N-acetylgalactosamine transporter subunit IIC n=1 Tax=Tetragenococcus halophilus TaxID=51669 RepID=UPI00077C79C8|nr:PTS N-acetylgalactosamine transporter subunit IIC [Tetragenococcus halophilus]MCF1685389.1 PTS sugar transporter subunit IIC [Tetragenococcus halophilus]